jgi:hypothetical protein
MADSTVQVPPIPTGGTNQVVDTAAVTRGDGTVVQRQRVVIGDGSNPENFLGVGSDGTLSVSASDSNNLVLILTQLKRIALILEIIADSHVSIGDVI